VVAAGISSPIGAGSSSTGIAPQTLLFSPHHYRNGPMVARVNVRALSWTMRHFTARTASSFAASMKRRSGAERRATFGK
jgi:hypothetical protein